MIMAMKKIVYLAAIAALSLTACSKELSDNRISDIPTGRTVTITATMGENPKSTFDKTDGFAWTAGESISVGTSNGDYLTFTCSNAATGEFSRSFSGDIPDFELAVTPVQSGSYTSAGEYQVTLPSSYNYIDGVTNALMVATPASVSGSNAQFSFRHAAALLKVTYKNVPVGTEKFHLETNTAITGTITLDGTGTGNIEIRNDNAALAGGSKGVDIVFSATASEQDMTFYVPVPTGTYSSISMDLGAAYTAKTLSGNLTIKRGEVYELPTVTLASGFTPYTVGATDNSTGWWGAFSQAYDISKGRTLHLEFENYGAKITDQAYHNWIAVVANAAVGTEGYAEYFVLRSDNYGWTPSAAITNLGLNLDNWANFIEKMDGAYVTITLSNQDGYLSFKSSSRAADGSITYTESYAHPSAIDGNVSLFLTTDLSHYNIKKVWYSGDSNKPKTFVGYRSGYDYYVYDTALSLDVVGTPRRIVAAYSDGSTVPMDASAFTFATNQQIAATAGNQVFNAVYQGDNVEVTIPVKVGTGAFGSTTLVTSGLVYSPFFGELAAGQSASKKLFVYSSCVNNWASPCADCAAAGFASFYCSLRMDNFGWGDYYNTATATSNWNWDKFLDYQNHDLVTMTWTANSANQGTMRFDVTYWDGETHYQEYANFYINQALAYRAFTENSYAVVID